MSQAHPEDKTLSDRLATREIDYKRTKTVCDAFVKGIVAHKRGVAIGATDSFSFRAKDGTTVFDPFMNEKGNAHYGIDNAIKHGGAAVDPWEHYGKPFCEGKLVTDAIAYAATVQVEAKAEGQAPLRKHPLYPKAGFAP